MSQSLDQRRAKHAWDVVQAAKAREDRDEFARQAKKLPVRIMACGLGQALAFIHAKEKTRGLILLPALADWILDKRKNPASTAAQPAADALIKAIMEGNSLFLRRATDEALSYLQWLTRFADAEAEGLTGDD